MSIPNVTIHTFMQFMKEFQITKEEANGIRFCDYRPGDETEKNIHDIAKALDLFKTHEDANEKKAALRIIFKKTAEELGRHVTERSYGNGKTVSNSFELELALIEAYLPKTRCLSISLANIEPDDNLWAVFAAEAIHNEEIKDYFYSRIANELNAKIRMIAFDVHEIAYHNIMENCQKTEADRSLQSLFVEQLNANAIIDQFSNELLKLSSMPVDLQCIEFEKITECLSPLPLLLFYKNNISDSLHVEARWDIIFRNRAKSLMPSLIFPYNWSGIESYLNCLIMTDFITHGKVSDDIFILLKLGSPLTRLCLAQLNVTDDVVESLYNVIDGLKVIDLTGCAKITPKVLTAMPTIKKAYIGHSGIKEKDVTSDLLKGNPINICFQPLLENDFFFDVDHHLQDFDLIHSSINELTEKLTEIEALQRAGALIKISNKTVEDLKTRLYSPHGITGIVIDRMSDLILAIALYGMNHSLKVNCIKEMFAIWLTHEPSIACAQFELLAGSFRKFSPVEKTIFKKGCREYFDTCSNFENILLPDIVLKNASILADGSTDEENFLEVLLNKYCLLTSGENPRSNIFSFAEYKISVIHAITILMNSSYISMEWKKQILELALTLPKKVGESFNSVSNDAKLNLLIGIRTLGDSDLLEKIVDVLLCFFKIADSDQRLRLFELFIDDYKADRLSSHNKFQWNFHIEFLTPLLKTDTLSLTTKDRIVETVINELNKEDQFAYCYITEGYEKEIATYRWVVLRGLTHFAQKPFCFLEYRQKIKEEIKKFLQNIGQSDSELLKYTKNCLKEIEAFEKSKSSKQKPKRKFLGFI